MATNNSNAPEPTQEQKVGIFLKTNSFSAGRPINTKDGKRYICFTSKKGENPAIGYAFASKEEFLSVVNGDMPLPTPSDKYDYYRANQSGMSLLENGQVRSFLTIRPVATVENTLALFDAPVESTFNPFDGKRRGTGIPSTVNSEVEVTA